MTNLKNKKILIVDDAEDILLVLKVILTKAGFSNVLLAKTGEEAIEICREEMPDIIVLDIMLPGVDGYNYCS